MYPYLNIIIIIIINTNTSIIVHFYNILFRFFVVSTKLTYSSSKFVLIFILYYIKEYEFDYICEYETLSILNGGLLL